MRSALAPPIAEEKSRASTAREPQAMNKDETRRRVPRECQRKRTESQPRRRLFQLQATEPEDVAWNWLRKKMISDSRPTCPEFPRVLDSAVSKPYQSTFNPILFNPVLIWLKSARNADSLPYSHWGGTDHEELRAPTRDGVRALNSLKMHSEASRLRNALSPHRPLNHLPKIFAHNSAMRGFLCLRSLAVRF
jgi:hypothetical protein